MEITFSGAYNDALIILLKYTRWMSESRLFVSSDVTTLHAVLMNNMYSFVCRLKDSRNTIIMVLNDRDTRYSSLFWKHWDSGLSS